MDSSDSKPHAAGSLFLVATPIGNLEDMTYRAVRILGEVDSILCEDTRRTAVLLDRYGIRKKTESYHIYNEHGRTPALIRRILSGEKIALVSDAGTPCIADPGFLLARDAVAAGIEPIVVPGVSALSFSIVASAMPCDKFAFFGFLPVKSGRRKTALEEILHCGMTAVIYESPFRIAKLVREIADVMGKRTPLAIIREATKIHEQVLRGTAGELAELAEKQAWKGEFSVVVDVRALSGDEESDD